jgi:hypothetical protein
MVPERGKTKGKVLLQALEDVEWACEARKQGMGAAVGIRLEQEEGATNLQVVGSWPRSVLGLLQTHRKTGTMSSRPY